MNKFRNLPAIVTLLAGFITSVIMIMHSYSLVNFLWVLVCTMFVFYVCSAIVRYILCRLAKAKEEKEAAEAAEAAAREAEEKAKEEEKGEDDAEGSENAEGGTATGA